MNPPQNHNTNSSPNEQTAAPTNANIDPEPLMLAAPPVEVPLPVADALELLPEDDPAVDPLELVSVLPEVEAVADAPLPVLAAFANAVKVTGI